MTAPLPENQPSSPATSETSSSPLAGSKQAINTWLETLYLGNEDGNCGCLLSIRNFINYLRYETPATADFTSEMLDWALDTIERPCDTAIVPIGISQTLYAIGDGKIKHNGSRTVQQQYHDYYEALEGKRYVFLPVNNGFASQFKPPLQDSQTSRSGHERPVSKNPRSTPRFGGHWSLIMIDTQAGTASYIDDRVEVARLGRKRYQILNINVNATIAANVLSGFETLMQRKRGQLTTSTLKWIPQPARSQQDGPDTGRCGPYVWNIVSFILANRNRTLSGSGSLKEFFSENNRVRITFDLHEARRQIQLRLQLRREMREISDKSHPYNLTPSTILELLTPEFLRENISGNFLKALLDKHEPPETAEDFNPDIDQQAEMLAYWEELKADQSKSNKPAADLTENAKELLWKQNLPHMTREDAMRILKKFSLDFGGAQTSLADEEWEKRQEFAVKQKRIPEPLGIAAFYDLVWKENQELRADYNLKNGLEPDHPGPDPPVQPEKGNGSKNTNTTRTSNEAIASSSGGNPSSTGKGASVAKARPKTFPKGFGPDQLPNFATATDKNLEPWIKEIEDLVGKSGCRNPIKRALLHRTYKGSFKTESEQDLRRVWSQDTNAFSEDERTANSSKLTSADIAQRMDDCYVDLEVPLFITLTDDEVMTWMTSLWVHRDVIEKVNQSAGRNLTRGLLHRLFVGEFAELRAEGDENSGKNIQLLDAWRTHDPQCSKKDFPTVQAAVDQLETLYGTQENLYLPFLRENPLYWPPRHLLKRGKKRKPEDELPGEAPKKTKTRLPHPIAKAKAKGNVEEPAKVADKGQERQGSGGSQSKDGSQV